MTGRDETRRQLVAATVVMLDRAGVKLNNRLTEAQAYEAGEREALAWVAAGCNPNSPFGAYLDLLRVIFEEQEAIRQSSVTG